MTENENEGDSEEESYVEIPTEDIDYAWMHEPPDSEPKNDSEEERA